MNCDETRRLLHGWIDRELGLESSLLIESHLEGCGACRARAGELEATRRSAAAAMAYHSAPPRLGAAISRRLAGSRPRSRRAWWLGAPVVALALVAGWLGGRHYAPPAIPAMASASQRVVFHLSSSDNVRAALRNVSNHLEAAPGARVVVVAHNTGVEFLLEGARDSEGNAYRPAVAELVRRGVEFRVCGNTLERADLAAARLIPEATRVPSGIAEISRLQSNEGFAYLRL